MSLYLLDIVNTLKTSHASEMRDIVGICVIDFNETLVLEKKHMHFNLIKMHPKYFFSKNVVFTFKNPKNVKWMKTMPKHF